LLVRSLAPLTSPFLQAVSTFKRPEKPLIMYEFDACPFCKKVREMCSYLDIECLYKPCPKDGPTFRPEGTQKSGKSMFPYMEDPNTGTSMLESDDIIKYLAETYGDGQVPLQLRLGVFGTTLPAGLSALGRCEWALVLHIVGTHRFGADLYMQLMQAGWQQPGWFVLDVASTAMQLSTKCALEARLRRFDHRMLHACIADRLLPFASTHACQLQCKLH
jgi:glutathione S-transferase